MCVFSIPNYMLFFKWGKHTVDKICEYGKMTIFSLENS